MSLTKYGFVVLSVLSLSGVVRADSELDGPKVMAPAVIVSQLNPVTQIVTNYRVAGATASANPDALDKLSPAERDAQAHAFLKAAVRPENKISEMAVQKVRSELDSDGSTAAHGYRWRGYYNHGYYGYYGNSFYNYYGGYNYYYQPAWSYTNYGYYRGGYAVYYPNYNDCYYTTYSSYGYGW